MKDDLMDVEVMDLNPANSSRGYVPGTVRKVRWDPDTFDIRNISTVELKNGRRYGRTTDEILKNNFSEDNEIPLKGF